MSLCTEARPQAQTDHCMHAATAHSWCDVAGHMLDNMGHYWACCRSRAPGVQCLPRLRKPAQLVCTPAPQESLCKHYLNEKAWSGPLGVPVMLRLLAEALVVMPQVSRPRRQSLLCWWCHLRTAYLATPTRCATLTQRWRMVRIPLQYSEQIHSTHPPAEFSAAMCPAGSGAATV